jgi:ATP-dependent Clp protease ATP-binding subunit ClpC
VISHLPFSETARGVLSEAKNQASRMKHRLVGTEALLIALVTSHDCDAAFALQTCGASLDLICQRLESESGKVPDERSVVDAEMREEMREVTATLKRLGIDPNPSREYTNRVCKITALAEKEARAKDNHQIGTGEILIGLLWDGGGVGAQILFDMGISLEIARRAMSTRERKEK